MKLLNLQMHSTSLSNDDKISYPRTVMDEAYDVHLNKVETKTENDN